MYEVHKIVRPINRPVINNGRGTKRTKKEKEELTKGE